MKDFHPLVSCVVPIYNAEKYLEQGVHSLLAQTYDNLEIILVDDWSSDDTWSICQRFADEYDKVIATRTDERSGGPLRGREKGIKVANGDWITFMDGDDYVGPKYIEHLLDGTQSGVYDIAVTGYSRVYPDGRVDDFIWNDYSQTSKKRLQTFAKHFLRQDFWTDPTDTAGQNLVRASVAKKTELSYYPNRVWAEDTLMALAFLENSENGVNFVDHHDFYWRQIPGSGSNGGFSDTANKPAFYGACLDILHRNNLLPLVSVIVPVFNVEHYLKDCVDSILAQTYPNLEIILVDDKSLDRSGHIANEYAHKDERIQVIHKPHNEGLNMARATGFKASSGDYVLFIDSDDMLTENCIAVALGSLLKNETDFARFGTLTFKDEEDLREKRTHLPDEEEVILKGKKDLYITQFDPKIAFANLPVLRMTMTVWGALYTRKLVAKIDWKATNYRVNEDSIWMLRYLENAVSGTYLTYIGYLYRYDDSITDVLSKRLTGNSLNGKPVGYLEYLNNLSKEYYHYNEKYKIGAREIIDNEMRQLFLFRAGNVTKADLWGAENNADYLPEVVKLYREKIDELQQEVHQKDIHIDHVESENRHLSDELAHMRAELGSHLSVKRSAKLTLGNIKRRIKKNSV
jgi:glycosyltransferase involved in cell wall biosynthesis